MSAEDEAIHGLHLADIIFNRTYAQSRPNRQSCASW
jgi:hypothetical protein